MTEQEKRELIECCKLMIDVSRNHEEVMIARIALASLNAPPVKLPGISELIETSGCMPNVRDVSLWDDAIKLCAENIRASGYQVAD